jgi:nitrogen regulatory protein P-II 1
MLLFNEFKYILDYDKRRQKMKYIIAIIQPSKLEVVKEALSKIEVFRLTVSDVQGFGRQKGHTEVYRGHEYKINFVSKVKLEIAVDDQYAESTIEAIANAARTGNEGKIGDGKIFMLPLEDVMRIRTRERGSDAL